MIEHFTETVRAAASEGRKLRIRGGGTRDFYGVALEGDILDTSTYRGVVDYEPAELVLTARAGTPLSDVETTLQAGGQMLGFEPPRFGDAATLGGTIAAGWSGPRRAAAGSARDFVLGARVVDARGLDLSFGGRVMKNVAGYDLSRLMAGSFGTLALLTEVSIKVLPRPEVETTLSFELGEADAIDRINRWAAQPLPLSGSCHVDGVLHVRLSGAAAAVASARAKMGGQPLEADAAFWASVRDHRHAFFSRAPTLWRLSIGSTTPPLGLGDCLVEWNGALRWIAGPPDAARVHAAARSAGGHATLFRAPERAADIQHLDPNLLALHKRVKQAIDPAGVFGPRRIHGEF